MLTFLNATTVRIITELTFTGRPASADRAERAGLINNVAPADELEAFTYDLAEAIAENAPLAIAVMKEQLRILAGAHPKSPQGFERIQALRRLVYDSNDYNEGIRAFKDKAQSCLSRHLMRDTPRKPHLNKGNRKLQRQPIELILQSQRTECITKPGPPASLRIAGMPAHVPTDLYCSGLN